MLKRLLAASLIAVVVLAFGACATASPPVTATPSVQQVAGSCLELNFADCFGGASNYTWLQTLGILAVVALMLLLLAFFEGMRESVKSWGVGFAGRISALFGRRPDPTPYYLTHFIADFTDPKYQPFTGDEVRDKPTLERVYVSLSLRPEAFGEEADRDAKGKAAGLERSIGRPSTGRIHLAEAVRQSQKHLSLIGGAGSGKSTFLQWAGLACAKDYARRRLNRSQREFAWALSKVGRSLELFRVLRWLAMTRPLFPIFVPLGEFDQFCEDPHDPQQPEKKLDDRLPRNAEAFLKFACWRFNRMHSEYKGVLTPDYLKRKLRAGALLLCDGVDEVVFEHRAMIRRAVQGFLREDYVATGSRVLLTSRQPGYAQEDWSADFLQCDVLPMTTQERDRLLGNWFRAIYTDADKARAKTRQLIDSLNDSDAHVQEMAQTPLLATIFAKLQHNKFRLPDQRARVYKEAVELILEEVHRKGDAERPPAATAIDSGERLRWLSHIAFELHQARVAEAGMMRKDLIERICQQVEAAKRPAEAIRVEGFMHTLAKNACLLEETQEHHYGFRSHRAFQEFLAGRYLAREYPKSGLASFVLSIARSPNKDQWEEPLRLAAGFLGIDSVAEVDDFLGLLSSLAAELDNNDHAGDWCRAVAALALFDLPEARWKHPTSAQSQIIEGGFEALTRLASALRDEILAELAQRLAYTGDQRLVRPLCQLLTANPPVIQRPRQRRAIGLALAAVGDPRFEAPVPQLVTIPAGEFRMGTGDDEAKWLKEKYDIEAWPDEQPSHTVYVSEFQIGRYPVTNAEYRAFVKAGGYNPDQPWWQGTGRLWRTAELRPDTSLYPSETRQAVERWLEQRPAARRHQPFFWDDAQWNADNLPVVGVTWYEAEAYCRWLSSVTGQPFRLPTEAEWEKAARGPGNAQWPWGDEWGDGRCNSAETALKATTPAGMFPHGAAVWSGGAVEDMLGNVWEWCGDWWDEKLYAKRAEAEQVERDPKGPLEGQARVVRGGSYFHYRRDCRAAYRSGFVPANFNNDAGFRVVRSP